MNKTRDLNSYIDHTFLNASGDEDAVLKLCEEAVKYGFASVCVNPSEVPLANAYKKNFGAELTICTVIGFPNGYNTTATKVFETADAITNGADEIDMVINIGWAKEGKSSNYRMKTDKKGNLSVTMTFRDGFSGSAKFIFTLEKGSNRCIMTCSPIKYFRKFSLTGELLSSEKADLINTFMFLHERKSK